MTSITLELPEKLAEQARAEGLFQPETLAALLGDALRQSQRARLFATVRRHQASAPPLIDGALIKAEIELARQARRSGG